MFELFEKATVHPMTDAHAYKMAMATRIKTKSENDNGKYSINDVHHQ